MGGGEGAAESECSSECLWHDLSNVAAQAWE